jgi:hypothetical protein
LGEFGRPIPAASGDSSALIRLAFINNGCNPEDEGGCDAVGPGACEPILLDSLAPLSAVKADGTQAEFDANGCIELRSAAGLAATPTDPVALEQAITRFRISNLPLIRAPADPDGWTWLAGDIVGTTSTLIEPAGVLGGNVLRQFAVAIRRDAAEGSATVTLYGDFPGTEADLADAGYGFLPVQFPGRLLGGGLNQRCDIDGDDCEIGGLDVSGQPHVALTDTRMVMDACVAAPPCGLRYASDPADPEVHGTCWLAFNEQLEPCATADDPSTGGEAASMVIATGVSNMVLFDDSAERMFGPITSLPGCTRVGPLDKACIEGTQGTLYVPGWPPAGDPAYGQAPLVQLRVRSLALLPGLTRTTGPGPCTRMQARLDALLRQCERFTQTAARAGLIANTSPPYSASGDDDSDPAGTSLAVLGEVEFAAGQAANDATRWLPVLLVPSSHVLAEAVRRDVAPEALEPDGLIGSVLFSDTTTVLDYTDPNPSVRLRCDQPHRGDCLVAPECRDDGQPACCYGLPLELVAAFIRQAGENGCCDALSPGVLAEIRQQGFCL